MKIISQKSNDEENMTEDFRKNEYVGLKN